MLFGYSGSSRPNNSRRHGSRSSSASVASHSSHFTTKGPDSATERPYKADPKSHSRGQSLPSIGKTTSASAGSDKLEAAERKIPGVFDFLEEDESEESSSSSESDDDDARGVSNVSKAQPKTTTIPATVGLQLARNTTASRRSTIQDPHHEKGSSTARPAILQDKKGTDYHTTPEAYYPRNTTLPPSPPESPEEQKLNKSKQTSRRNIKSLDVSSGYGLIASRLTTPHPDDDDGTHRQLPPLYRRFEHLNHRVLLHLQDEIAQMEEELHVLDEYEEMHRSVTADQEGKSKPMPASRRMDAQTQTYSNLHHRRQELMESIIGKTEQYNNALCAYSKVLETLPRASEQDIQTYRAWMKEHNPVAIAESRFLDHDQDLVSITPRLSSSSNGATTSVAGSANATSPFPAIAIASTAILLPLLAFSIISEFSGRLLMVTIVAGAVSAVASNYPTGAERWIDGKDGLRGAGVYFGFMAVAAMFIP